MVRGAQWDIYQLVVYIRGTRGRLQSVPIESDSLKKGGLRLMPLFDS